MKREEWLWTLGLVVFWVVLLVIMYTHFYGGPGPADRWDARVGMRC